MIVWKFICMVIIFDYVTSLSEDAVFDEDDLKILTDLYSRWSRVLHRFPEAQWMLNSFPHLRSKRFNDDGLYPDKDEWLDPDQIVANLFTENNILTTENYDIPVFDGDTTTKLSTDSDIIYITNYDGFDGKETAATKLANDSDITYTTTDSTELKYSISTQNVDETSLTTNRTLKEFDNNTILVTETIGPWNDNDTDALVIEILQFLKNRSGLIKEIEKIINKGKSQCNRDLWYAVRSIDSEAIGMLDAAGKPASGILRGNVRWMGDYRQCLNVSIPAKIVNKEKDFTLGGFGGLYCYTSWDIYPYSKKNDSVPLATGLCVPDSCTAEDLKFDSEEIEHFLSGIPVLNKIRSLLKLNDITCQETTKTWTAGDIVYTCVLSMLAILLAFGTLCDLLFSNKQQETANTQKRSLRSRTEMNATEDASEVPDVVVSNEATAIAIGIERMYGDDVPLSIQSKHSVDETKTSPGGLIAFLICFSVYSNARKVLTVGNQQGQLNCLHGIRFLSLSWVIFGHVFVYALSSVGNIADVLEDIDSFSFQVVGQATFAVDTFFLISGLLLSYLYFKDCEKRNGKTNWIYYYVHRIWRLTPAFALILGFYTTLWVHLGSGPLWPKETENGTCKKYWWWNLLYIVNFHGVQKNCMGWTWYLANDMQFYIISPIFLILLKIFPVIGIVVVSAVAIASWIATVVLSANNDFRLFMGLAENMQLSDVMNVEENQWKYFDTIYDKPYTRIGPYLIGLLLGYALYRNSGRQKFMKTWVLIVGWIAATFIGTSVVFGVYHVEMGRITAAFYNGFARSVWSMAVGWVIFVCLTGHADPVNKLLSWKFWVPASRLTYCAYLVHPMIMNWYYSSLQILMHFQMNTMVMYYFGYLIFAYIVGFIASMAFESPMMVLEKFIIKKFSK